MREKILLIFILSFTAVACSLYQSEGREFMEDEGLEFVTGVNKNMTQIDESGHCFYSPNHKIDKSRFLPFDMNQGLENKGIKTYLSSTLNSPRALVQYQNAENGDKIFCVLNYQSLGDLNFSLKSDINEAVLWILQTAKEL